MYERLIAANDERILAGMERQVLDSSSPYYGGVADPETGVAWINHTTGTPTYMAYWGAALVNPASAYYRNEALLERFKLAGQFMLRKQNADGTISPGWTNFNSPPDTAFVVVGYSQLYQLLAADSWEQLKPVVADMKLFLERSAPGLLTGGCHTPNHRWVLCAALGFLYDIFGMEEAAARAEEWIREGMDITPDGEWTERSNGIYSAVSDIMLIHAARLLKRPELLEPVRQNLRMMIYLVHPSGEVVTDYSGRQDLGRYHDLSPYYLAYAIMARLDKDAQFAAMAQAAELAVKDPGVLSVNILVRMMLEPELCKPEVQPGELPVRYEKVLNGSFDRHGYIARMDQAGHQGKISHSRLHTDFGAPVVRIRDEDTSATIMTEVPSFFALQHGKVRLLAVQAASFFYPGFVPMQTMEAVDGGYVLTGEQKKGYYGPVDKALLPKTASEEVSPWYLLPHQSRALTHEQTFKVRVEVIRTADGWDFWVRSQEPADVMTQLSFVFGNEGEFVSGELLTAKGGALLWKDGGNESLLWKDGTVRYQCGDDWLEMEGGELGHTSAGVREANLPPNCKTLLVNLLTPFDKKISIRLSPAGR